MPFGHVPKVQKGDIETAFAEYFNLGTVLSYRRLKKGFANLLYHVKTTKGEYVFKIAVRNNPHRVQYEVDLLRSLKGLPVPGLIKTKSGLYWLDFKGHKTLVYSFLHGKQEHRFTRVMLYEIGEFLGKLHVQVENFSSLIRREHFYTLSRQRLSKVLMASKRLKNQKIKRALTYLGQNALRYTLPSSLPKGAMHMDVKPENVLFKGGHLSGVVDFDNAYPGPLVFDLADTLMWFCSDGGKFDFVKAKAVVVGYNRVRKLSIAERNSLLPALHNCFMGIALCGIDYLIHNKLPEAFVLWTIDNLFAVEYNLHISTEEFLKALDLK